MAKKPQSPEPPEDTSTAHDPVGVYDVTLTKPIMRNGFTYLPRNQLKMSGKFLDVLISEGHGDAIGTATKR